MIDKEIKIVEGFLEDWPGEKALLSPILVNIKHGRYHDGSVEFAFCETSEECEFWKKDIEKYLYLYVYSLLTEWSDNASLIIKKRLNSFIEVHKDKILCDITDFVSRLNTVPLSIHTKIGFIADSYLWKEKLEIPYLTALVNAFPSLLNSDSLPSSFIDGYKNLLLNNMWNYQNEIEKYLQFCYVLDSRTKNKKTALEEMLAMTCDKKFDKLENFLPVYPYYGDDFGLALLDFCKKNKSLYKLTSEIIAKYEFQLGVESWLTEIREKLGKDGKPYSVELCKRTSSHKHIVTFLNDCHNPFWDDCNNMAMSVVEKVVKGQNEESSKRSFVRNSLYDGIKKIGGEAKRLMFNKVNSLIVNAKEESVLLFIDEIEKEAMEKGKNIKMTTKVLTEIHSKLISEYVSNNVPEPSLDFDGGFPYAKKVAETWVTWWAENVRNANEISKEQYDDIKNVWNTSVWEIIQNDINGWCESFYGDANIDSSSSYVETLTYDEDDIKYRMKYGI